MFHQGLELRASPLVPKLSWISLGCTPRQGEHPAGGGLQALSLLSFCPLNIIHPSFYEAIHIQILLEVEGPFISSVYSAHRELLCALVNFISVLSVF